MDTKSTENIMILEIINMLRFLDDEELCPNFKNRPTFTKHALAIPTPELLLITNAVSRA
jgi:hypothetical protein